MHTVKKYHFLESSRVVCLDDTMIDVKDISAIHVTDVSDGLFHAHIMLKSKGFIKVSLSVGIKDALQADFLRERARRIEAAEFIHKKTLEKESQKDQKVHQECRIKGAFMGLRDKMNVWWEGA